MDNDDFGDRMKRYEGQEASRRFMPLLPVVARLDGKNFSKFTKGLARPFDGRLSAIMIETTRKLAEISAASCGYTQSDEITLAWYSSSTKSQIYFDGRIQKMVSVLAATCTSIFQELLRSSIPEKGGKAPVFDCRVWQMPTLEEAANVFLWREQDATKNSISMAAGEYYSHKELMGKKGPDKIEMLYQKGVKWNDYAPHFKRGTFVKKVGRREKLTDEELERLPPKHIAKINPHLEWIRSKYEVIDTPPFGSISNRSGFLFMGQEPELFMEK